MPEAPRSITIASHERSGTHLLIDVLRRNFDACRARPRWGDNPHNWLYFSLDRLREDHPRAVDTAYADRALARARCPMMKTHMTPEWVGVRPDAAEWFHNAVSRTCLLHVYRDGRDVACSFHRLQQRVNPGTPASLSEFLRTRVDGLNVPARWADHTRRWLDNPRANSVTFPDLVRNTSRTIDRIGQLAGLTSNNNPAPLPPRGQSAWSARLARLTGKIQSSNLVAQGEHGQPLKWREAFTKDDRAFFHEHAGQVLIETGFVESDSWIQEPSPGVTAA